MDIAKLGIQITQQGADEAKAKLDALTASGAKAEAQFTTSSQKIQQSLATQTAAVKDAYAAWERGEASLNDERLLRHEGLIKQSTQDYYALAAAERAATEAQVQQIAAQGSGLYATQAMIKAQSEAIAMDARMSAGLQLHGLQLGRLNQEIGTFIGRLTGTNTAVTRLAAQVGGAVVGYGSMIAVLGGVTLAIAGAEAIYNKFTEASRKAREENERLLKVLDDIAKRRATTEAGTTQAAIAAGQAKLLDLQAQLANAEAFARSTAPRGYAGGGLSVSYGPSADEAFKNVNDLKAKVASAEAELTALVRKGAEDRDRAVTDDIASLVKSGQATEKQVATAKALLTGYEQSLNALQKAGSSDTATLVDLADKIKTLNDALYPKQHVAAGAGITGPTVEQQAVLDGLLKQLDAMRKVDDENHREALSAQAAAQAVGIQGAQLDILNAKRKAELDTLQAYQQYSGPALTDRLNGIAATEQQAIATANVKQRFEDAQAAEKLWTDAQKEANQIAEKNVQTTQKQDAATAEAIRKQQQYAADLAGIWRDGIDRIATDGTRSFERMAEDVLKLFSRLLDRMRKEGQDAHLFSFATAGLTGGIVGYQFGQRSGSVENGAVGGAATGAYQGFQVAGPVGALVGGLTGAVGGLLGAADAHKQAAQALKDAAKQIEQGLAQYGATNAIQSALNANQSQYLQLQTAIINALKAGISANPSNPKGSVETAHDELARLEAERAANIKRIVAGFFDGIEDKIRSLSGPEGDYENQLLAIQREYADNVAAAQAVYQTTGNLSDLTRGLADAEALRVKEEAALKAAEAERQVQLQDSLDAREADARGLTAEGEAIRRKAQEEKELFDATQQGYTKEQIAQLKYIQGLEDEAAAKQKIIDATAAYNDAVNAGPTGSLATKAASENAALMQKLTDDTTQYNAAVTKLATDTANGADEATIAADKNAVLAQSITVAGDKAAIAAAQFQQAAEQMAQASNEIEKDVSLGFISGSKGLDELKQLFGFSGLSDDQIRALYTPYAGTPLTNDQIQQNQNVETYLRDVSQWGQQVTDVLTKQAAGGSTGEQAAIANAAQSLTEVTGNRMADYLSAILVVEKEQLDVERRAFAGGSAGPFTPASPATDSLPVLNQIAAGIDRLNTKTTSGSANLALNVTFKIENLSDPVERRRIIADLTDDIDRKLQELATDSKLRAGSTLKTV